MEEIAWRNLINGNVVKAEELFSTLASTFSYGTKHLFDKSDSKFSDIIGNSIKEQIGLSIDEVEDIKNTSSFSPYSISPSPSPTFSSYSSFPSVTKGNCSSGNNGDNGNNGNNDLYYGSDGAVGRSRYATLACYCRVILDPDSVPLPYRSKDLTDALLEPRIPNLAFYSTQASVNRLKRFLVLAHPDKNPHPKAKEAFQRLLTIRKEMQSLIEDDKLPSIEEDCARNRASPSWPDIRVKANLPTLENPFREERLRGYEQGQNAKQIFNLKKNPIKLNVDLKVSSFEEDKFSEEKEDGLKKNSNLTPNYDNRNPFSTQKEIYKVTEQDKDEEGDDEEDLTRTIIIHGIKTSTALNTQLKVALEQILSPKSSENKGKKSGKSVNNNLNYTYSEENFIIRSSNITSPSSCYNDKLDSLSKMNINPNVGSVKPLYSPVDNNNITNSEENSNNIKIFPPPFLSECDKEKTLINSDNFMPKPPGLLPQRQRQKPKVQQLDPTRLVPSNLNLKGISNLPIFSTKGAHSEKESDSSSSSHDSKNNNNNLGSSRFKHSNCNSPLSPFTAARPFSGAKLQQQQQKQRNEKVATTKFNCTSPASNTSDSCTLSSLLSINSTSPIFFTTNSKGNPVIFSSNDSNSNNNICENIIDFDNIGRKTDSLACSPCHKITLRRPPSYEEWKKENGK